VGVLDQPAAVVTAYGLQLVFSEPTLLGHQLVLAPIHQQPPEGAAGASQHGPVDALGPAGESGAGWLPLFTDAP